MPYLNEVNEWCSGIAGVGVYWSGGTIRQPGQGGGGAQWWDIDEVLFQDTTQPTARLMAHDITNGNERELFVGPVYGICGSGHGHWAILSAVAGVSVVYDSFGRAFHGADLPANALGPDGSLVIKDNRASAGPYHVWEPDGSNWLLTDGEVYDLQNYGNHRLTWKDGQSVRHSVGYPVALPLAEPAWWFKYLEIDGVLWQLYQMYDGTLVFHPRGDQNGYAIYQGDTFLPDVAQLHSGSSVRIVWSVTQGDVAASIRTQDVSLASPRKNLLASPLPTNFTLRAFPRKVWVAPFYEVSGQYGVADTLLGNAVMLVAPGDVPLAPTDRPRIVSSSAFDAAWANITVAYWASGGNVVDLEAEVRRFPTTPEKPTIAYLDSPDPARIPVAKPAWVSDKVWFSVQAYRGFGETIANFRQRIETMLNKVSAWGKPMGLTPGFYDRRSAEGRLTLPEMEECIPLFDEWMQRYSIVTLQPFSRRRPGGTIDYPVMEEWLRREGLANPVRPNRYDWWTPATTPLKDSLTNKLSQSVELISLTKTEKDFLLGKLS